MTEVHSAAPRTQTAQFVKRPPHSIEAEKSVVGALLLDYRSWNHVCDVLVADDFYLVNHQIIFSTIEKLSKKNQPFDALSVAETLKLSGQLEEVGGESVLFSLANSTPSASNIIAYANIVREQAILRCLVQAGQHIANLGYAPEDKEGKVLLDEAEKLIFEISDRREGSEAGPEGIDQILAKTTARIDQLFEAGDAITGLSTGFRDLDEMTAGLQPGDLVIAAGRPSMGKTAFSMNIAEHAAITSGKPVLIFSLEMPSESLVMRMLSSLGRVNQQRIRTGKLTDDDWPRLTSAVSMLSEAKLFIDDTPGLSPNEMRAKARRITQKEGQLSLIVVDYLQLMQIPGSKENRTNEISEISRGLKLLAKELNVPLVALSQLNRGLEQRTDKRPVMSDIRESGAIEQDADVILFIYRDEVYHDDSEFKGTAEIVIGKQRNGPIGKVRLTFLGEYTRFEDYAKPQWSD